MAQQLSEDAIQSSYHKWLWNNYPLTRGLCYAIGNGGLRTAKEAMKLKATGTLPGMPDYHHAIPSKGFCSLYIEFKKPKANINTEHVKLQLRRHEQLRAAGNMVAVCKSLEEAQKLVLNYLPEHYKRAVSM